jgi:DNA-binding PadR family transcriptional regulator
VKSRTSLLPFLYFLRNLNEIARRTMPEALKDMEQLVLLALVRLGEEAYGIPVRADIEERAGRSVSLATIYGVLERLETEGLAQAHMSEPLPERGGRARRMYRITPRGLAALRTARQALTRIWGGPGLHPDLRIR